MSFFYDLNKKLDGIRATPEVTHQQLNERDEGKPGKNFAKIAKDAGERYGSKAAGERVAGAVRNKLRDQGKLEEQQVDEKVEIYTRGADADWASMSKNTKNPNDPGAVAHRKSAADAARAARAAGDLKFKGQSQYTDTATTGQGRKVQAMRSPKDVQEGGSYLNYADSAAENPAPPKKPMAAPAPKPQGVMDKVKSIGNKVAGGINKLVGHGSDEEMRKDLQRKSGAPVTGKKPAVAPMHPSDEYDYFTGRDKVRGGEQQVKEKMSPAKQKSFAALAPPYDKKTFADKIAGAKKEVDEMLGQVAAEAMRNAVGGGQGRNAAMDEERSKGTAFDMSTPRAAKPKVGSIERGHKHDIKHTATGRMVTRRVDDQGNSVGADDDSDTQAGPRGRGRPKGTKGAIGAKGPSGKSKLMTREGANQGQAQQIVDDLAELRAMAKQAQRGGEFPQGFASQLEVALYAAMTLIKNQQSGDAQVREESTTKKDDRAEKAGKKVAKDIEYDEGHKGKDDNKAEKAGKKVTKDIEYDEKKKDKEEEVDESTTSGSVATSTATKSSKGSVVGKGIYDSMNFELEQMIAESMSINMSDSTEGGKSLTITATDEDAMKLGMMLKNAGLGGGDSHGGDMHSHEETCPTCGMEDCGCGDVQEAVDENAPDWPTNTETSDNAMQYSGGLNKPKASGMATIPVTDVSLDGEDMFSKQMHEDDLRRMMEMAGIKQAELEPWKETMKEGDLDEAYVMNPKQAWNYGDEAGMDAEKKYDDEYNLYKTPGADPKLAQQGFTRAQAVHDRLRNALKQKPNVAEEQVQEGEECSKCHNDPCKCESVEESIRRMKEIAGIREAKKDLADKDYDGDGKRETGAEEHAGSVDKAIKKSQEEKKVDESIFALTNQWKAYRG